MMGQRQPLINDNMTLELPIFFFAKPFWITKRLREYAPHFRIPNFEIFFLLFNRMGETNKIRHPIFSRKKTLHISTGKSRNDFSGTAIFLFVHYLSILFFISRLLITLFFLPCLQNQLQPTKDVLRENYSYFEIWVSSIY